MRTDIRDVTGLYRLIGDEWRCVVCDRAIPKRWSGMGRVSHARTHVQDGRAVRLSRNPARFQPKVGA